MRPMNGIEFLPSISSLAAVGLGVFARQAAKITFAASCFVIAIAYPFVWIALDESPDWIMPGFWIGLGLVLYLWSELQQRGVEPNEPIAELNRAPAMSATYVGSAPSLPGEAQFSQPEPAVADVSPETVCAGFGVRFVAQLIDQVILIIP